MITNLKRYWQDPHLRKRCYIGFGIIVFSLIILASLTDPVLKLPAKKINKVADFEFENVKITFLENGVSNWQLKAKQASIFKNSNLTHLNDVNGIVFHDEKAIVYFESPTANFKLDSSDMKLTQATATINNKTRRIIVFADALSWISDQKTFIGHKNTSIKTRGLHLFGDYFKVDVPFQKLIISDQGKAIINQNQNED